MGETFWGEHRVGERVIMGRPGTEDEATMVLLPSDVPDWVAIPEETPHADAGRRLRVEGVVKGPCAACAQRDNVDREVRILLLRGSSLVVGMCASHGWVVCEARS